MKPSFMKRVAILAVIAGATCGAMRAQTPGQRLQGALALERDGKPGQAVAEAQSLLDAHVLDTFETGKAWNVMGLAYEDEGELQQARRAYEESVRILEPLPNIRDYAMALDSLGSVYVTMGQFEAADKLRMKALGLYERAGDHRGVAVSANDLALSAFRQNRMNRGNEYLARALKEARAATNLDNDDRAAIVTLQGWKAWHDRDYSTSVAKYQQALELWRSLHGDSHPTTGWSHVLLGEAYESAGQLTAALTETRKGVDILDRSLGRQNLHSLLAQLAYARVLDADGSHTESARIKTTAEQMLKESGRRQCPGCTVSAMALR